MKDINEIRKQKRTLRNRLFSIAADADFVSEITVNIPQFPVYPNERCGSWYVDPKTAKFGSVYFKSTDGHFGQWNFNSRRNNFHILSRISEFGGCFIVDSTRNGKKIPDALSKTIPIWCCIVNRLAGLDSNVYTTPIMVSPSEHSQITDKMDQLEQNARNQTILSEFSGLKLLKKPLRPIWITTFSSLFKDGCPWDLDTLDFYPIILVSASVAVPDGLDTRNGYTYVQGSADDEEAWSNGLDFKHFWKFKHEILNCSSELDDFCGKISQNPVFPPDFSAEIASTGISIGCINSFDELQYDLIIYSSATTESSNSSKIARFPMKDGKRGSVEFKSKLKEIIQLATKAVANNQKVLVASINGRDKSVGVAMAIILSLYTLNGSFERSFPSIYTKQMILDYLLAIQMYYPQANPSRSTLQRLNEYFVGRPCTSSDS